MIVSTSLVNRQFNFCYFVSPSFFPQRFEAGHNYDGKKQETESLERNGKSQAAKKDDDRDDQDDDKNDNDDDEAKATRKNLAVTAVRCLDTRRDKRAR